MIFNNPRKGSLSQRGRGHLQGLSNPNHRQASSHLSEHVLTDEPEDDIAQRDTKVFGSDDFIFLSDNVRCWVVRASDIMTLQACGNYTRVNLSGATALIRRPLRECECRLDPSTFFRTRRDCVVNLRQVKQMRMLDAKRFLFVLLDGKEVAMSRKQSLLFRKQKAL
ncbi:MAG TPA: LytTR family DNA-binding domain-containing protein [Terrimicrobiaceae bacterium]